MSGYGQQGQGYGGAAQQQVAGWGGKGNVERVGGVCDGPVAARSSYWRQRCTLEPLHRRHRDCSGPPVPTSSFLPSPSLCLRPSCCSFQGQYGYAGAQQVRLVLAGWVSLAVAAARGRGGGGSSCSLQAGIPGCLRVRWTCWHVNPLSRTPQTFKPHRLGQEALARLAQLEVTAPRPAAAAPPPLAVQATARRSSRVVTRPLTRPSRRCGGEWEDILAEAAACVLLRSRPPCKCFLVSMPDKGGVGSQMCSPVPCEPEVGCTAGNELAW